MASAPSADVARTVDVLVANARRAARPLAGGSARPQDQPLRGAAAGLRQASATNLEANRADLERTKAAGESAAFLDRLTLTPARIEAMAKGTEEITMLPDPVGETIAAWRRPN